MHKAISTAKEASEFRFLFIRINSPFPDPVEGEIVNSQNKSRLDMLASVTFGLEYALRIFSPYSIRPKTSDSSAMRITTPLKASTQYRACRVLSTSGRSSSMRGSECKIIESGLALRISSLVT